MRGALGLLQLIPYQAIIEHKHDAINQPKVSPVATYDVI